MSIRIHVSIFDPSDFVTYDLYFSEDDAIKAAINWGKQKVELPSIGGSIDVMNGQAYLTYSSGSGGTGSIGCNHEWLKNKLNNPANKVETGENH